MGVGIKRATAKFHELHGRNFLTLADYTEEQINSLLDLAENLKYERRKGIPHHYLEGKILGMIFDKASTRTRVSFEAGIYQLGGSGIFLSSNDIQIGRGESITDTAQVLSSYVDGIMIRTYSQSTIELLAEKASIPVINGLTDLYHPCQVLADFQTIKELKGQLNGVKIAYIGDGNNMAHSLLIGAATMGMRLSIASPKNYQPDADVVINAKRIGSESGAVLEISDCPEDAVQQADVIYTDVWASMGQEEEQQKREIAFTGYQVNRSLLSLAKSDVIFMHCLPAHRGEEVSADVIDGVHSVVFQQAENRLHAQKALMVALLGK
ncbi:MAG: ornithine carbamoyltransferase [Bacillota bacterium]|uniref:Ornithine carbamoyltransferase n=1 Tax=Virgibacillus salarius TaxID=447199 RepID=A0A941DSZ3_9BACI|nr:MULTISPECIES: ornithine carbamoyltransferase [Bacillaceae]NAZ09308.1 ornithine carbamoyltransferase [Agaribacter marinus]MBR7796599.1 ornithine carbamoyltransferase [Virgibacillus salarius]MCC2251331.1 ornithine carbamoyltransferase [Virgibacillus sp. AGTR]MDY7043790.1 ornithine carbamoyltransferase [Virgibacillus sp. M23]QRZ19448.1 ornithine carbamoyltransferase [Virgibacillus sp. AGTR]